MASRVKIGATSYKADSNYSFTQQAGQASTASIGVLKGANPIPSVFAACRIDIDTTIKTIAALTIPAGGATITRAAGSFITDGWVAGMRGRCIGDHTQEFIVEAVAALTIDLVGTMTAGALTSIIQFEIAFAGTIKSVEYPEYSTGFEDAYYGLSISSYEDVLNQRKVNQNWYNNTVAELVTALHTDYLVEEGFSIGYISAAPYFCERIICVACYFSSLV